MNDKQLPSYVLPDEEQQSRGVTPLHIAVSLFNFPDPDYPGEQLMADVLTQTDDINVQDNQGNTALHNAAGLKVRGAVKMLLEAGAEINPQNNQGRTPLWRNTWENADAEIITMLLDAGADPTIKGGSKSPLDLVLKFPKEERIKGFARYLSKEQKKDLEEQLHNSTAT